MKLSQFIIILSQFGANVETIFRYNKSNSTETERKTMKAFFERYSYDSVRMLLNQVAISMFGFALAMTAAKGESDSLLLWSSIASIVFYLALTYGTAWKAGSGDKLSIEYGRTHTSTIACIASPVSLSTIHRLSPAKSNCISRPGSYTL